MSEQAFYIHLNKVSYREMSGDHHSWEYYKYRRIPKAAANL